MQAPACAALALCKRPNAVYFVSCNCSQDSISPDCLKRPFSNDQPSRCQGSQADHKLCWCRWLDADGSKQVGSAFEVPEEVLRLPQGVKSVAAGLHSSAAISMDGQLWMWGKVISKVNGTAVMLMPIPLYT